SGKVCRIYFDVARKGQQLPVDTVVEFGRVFLNAARQIRPTHSADEQGVTREHEPGIGPATQVRHDEADTFRRVTGGVKDVHPRVAEFDFLAAAQGFKWKVDVGCFVQVIGRAHSGG